MKGVGVCLRGTGSRQAGGGNSRSNGSEVRPPTGKCKRWPGGPGVKTCGQTLERPDCKGSWPALRPGRIFSAQREQAWSWFHLCMGPGQWLNGESAPLGSSFKQALGTTLDPRLLTHGSESPPRAPSFTMAGLGRGQASLSRPHRPNRIGL